ncbi:GNAT family N-acetyltransferase [Pseudoxanthomonas sp. SGD-10]|nr:GNAT family N-acetyltransferase [Pseudoxanthomonas sp. SGD-10]
MIDIRKADKSDIAIISRLANEIWWPTYSDYLSTEQIRFMLDDIYTEASLEKQMNEGHKFIIVEKDSQPIGFSSYHFTGDYSVCKIQKLYLHPQLQGQGGGTAVINYISKEAVDLGVLSLELNVNRNNPAKAFYEKMGFTVIEITDIPYHQFVLNDFIMQKCLK